MRTMVSLGKIAAVPSDFQRPCESVTHGGVHFALPVLLAGFYGLEHIFILLGMLDLCRIKSIEQLRSTAPGEWAKLLGLDRCPEAKTLRARIKILTTYCWVNGLDGLPFFRLNQAVDPCLIRALEEQVVPELQPLVPQQPTEAQLQAVPLHTRLRLIFDREGYSPGFFKRMVTQRIACQTYHKHSGGNWPGRMYERKNPPKTAGAV